MFNALAHGLRGRSNPQDYLLSRYGGAAAAYSLRRLTTGVDNVVRARESVGDTEADFTAGEVSGGALREFALQNDADLIRFADQAVAADERMYFDGVNDYIEVTGMTSAADYFGACTISATIHLDSSSGTDTIWSLGSATYRLIAYLGSWYVNNTNTSVAVSAGLQTVSVLYNSSGQATSLSIDGVEVWTGTAAVSTPGTSFYVGTGSTGNRTQGLIYNFSLSGSAVKNFAFNGYGNTDADWEDIVGSNDGTVNGSPALFSGQGFDAYVTTLYDQSGNSRDATQATAGDQPQIVADGVVNTDSNGVPSIAFTNSLSHDLTATWGQITGSSACAIFGVYGDSGVADQDAISWGAATATGLAGLGVNSGGSYRAPIASDQNSGTSASGTMEVVANTFDGTGDADNTKLYISGTKDPASAASATTQNTTSTDLHIGSRSNNSVHFQGNLSEAIIYDSDKSADRAAIEANLGAYYGITIA